MSYQKYFTTPYFIFVRDTVSLLAHLALHYAVCLAPSSIPFSVLEWAIWLFYMGRIAMESKQFSDIKVQRIAEVEVPTLEEPVDYIEVTCEPQDSGIHAWKRSSIGKKFMKYLRYRQIYKMETKTSRRQKCQPICRFSRTSKESLLHLFYQAIIGSKIVVGLKT